MRKLKLDEFTEYRFLSGIELSTDARYACFAVHKANVEENNYDSNLWLYDLQNSQLMQLTSFNRESSLLWLADGRHILFSSIREEKDQNRKAEGENFTQFYRINAEGGEAQKYFSIPLKVAEIAEAKEGTFVFTAIDGPGEEDLSILSQEDRARALKKRQEEQDYEVIDEIPFWSNGKGYTNQKRNRIYTYDLKTKQYQVLSKEKDSVVSFSLNKETNKVVYFTQGFQGVSSRTNGISLYDLETGKTTELLKEGRFSCAYGTLINDNRLIFIGTEMKDYGINENRKFYQIDLSTNEITCITPTLDISLYGSVGSDCRYGTFKPYQIDGDYLYFVSTVNDSAYLNRIHLMEGTIEQLTHEKGSVDGFAVKGKEILFVALRGLRLQEIYRLKEGQEIRLTSFNQWLGESVKLSVPQPLKVEVVSGFYIEGWVMLPVDYDESKKYPAILDIHGGPKTVYGEVFYHEMQYWANEGYFVFFCNPRGSDGRGNDFSDIRGKYGTVDYDDIMKFTDEVLKQYPNIDESRVGVTGGSYGGFMTNWIIGHTDRFKAAVSQRSISNWISKFGTTDIGFYFVDDQQGATPWNNHDKLWWHSPLKYADQVKTPTLFIHSDEDYRCWITEAYQMFTALKYHGVDSRLCIFRGENHELSRSGKPKHRIRRLEEITSWFNQYLRE